MAIFSSYGAEFLLRWLHFFAGITWIGMLYYFNFVQTEWFKEADPNVKSAAIRGLVPRALWWFRWGAMFTFLSGLFILVMRFHSWSEFVESAWGILIGVGGFIGTLMFINVWLIIWPNQKIVIASANQVAVGGAPMPEAAPALARAGLVSRTNLLFSIPMLFFMGAASHLGVSATGPLNGILPLTCIVVILALLEWNALKGKMGLLSTIQGAITCGVVLTAIFYGIIEGLL